MQMLIRVCIIVLILCSTCYAEKYYVFIDKKSVVEKGREAGQNEMGDVIAVCPFTPQYKPTKAELDSCKVLVVDLKDEDIKILLEPVCDGDY